MFIKSKYLLLESLRELSIYFILKGKMPGLPNLDKDKLDSALKVKESKYLVLCVIRVYPKTTSIKYPIICSNRIYIR